MNYLDKVFKMAKEIVEPDNPKSHHIAVFHDDWCGIFKGKPCDCNPEVRDVTQHYEGTVYADNR